MISKSTIRRWNKKFKDATAAGKRVLITQDVIQQTLLGVYKPNSTYVKVKTRLKWDLDFQSNSDKVKCECCGVGSCLISLVRLTDNATIEQVDEAFDSSYGIKSRLKKYFSRKQLALIEHIFEMTPLRFTSWGEVHTTIGGEWYIDFPREEVLKLAKSQKLYKGTKKKRLIQIMENIVRNNGTFKPHQG